MPGRRQSQRLNGFQTQSSQNFILKLLALNLHSKLAY